MGPSETVGPTLTVGSELPSPDVTVGPTLTVGPGLPPLNVSLDVPSEVRQGEVVALTLRVRNPSDRAVILRLDGRPAHDFVVTKPNGEEVWSWTFGRFSLDILDIEELGPGEELRFEAQWDQTNNEGEPVPAGTYEVNGVLRWERPLRLEAEPVLIVILP